MIKKIKRINACVMTCALMGLTGIHAYEEIHSEDISAFASNPITANETQKEDSFVNTDTVIAKEKELIAETILSTEEILSTEAAEVVESKNLSSDFPETEESAETEKETAKEAESASNKKKQKTETTAKKDSKKETSAAVTKTETEKKKEKETVQKKTDPVYQEVYETVYPTIILNVRTGPGTGYRKLGGFEKGEAVTRTAIGNNGWSKVIFRGREVYACSEYLSYTKPELNSSSGSESSSGNAYREVYETVYPTIILNVRTGPGTGYHKLGGFEKGEPITRTGIGNNGWSKVLFMGMEGYVCSDYLSYTKP